MKNVVLLLAAAFCGYTADVDPLIESARNAPAEFAADAMIRLAASDKIEKPRRIELLAQAFARAADAQHPFPEHAVPLRLDGTATYWNRLFLQDLDTLSLRMRAIETLIPLDSAKARELFTQIPPLQLPRLKCDDFLLYDPSRFYTVMGKVAGTGLARYAAALSSAVELAPMARVILASSTLPNADFEKVVNAFAKAMGKIEGDDRSFSYSTSLGKEILNLVDECKRRQVSPLLLAEGYRLYLVANFSGTRCADSDLMQPGQQSFGIYTGQPADPVSANFVSFFNEKLRMAPLAPIQVQEVTPARLEGVATGFQYCQDDDCKAFVARFRGLVFTSTGQPIPPAERRTPEWQNKLKTELARLGDWKGKDILYFREKS